MFIVEHKSHSHYPAGHGSTAGWHCWLWLALLAVAGTAGAGLMAHGAWLPGGDAGDPGRPPAARPDQALSPEAEAQAAGGRCPHVCQGKQWRHVAQCCCGLGEGLRAPLCFAAGRCVRGHAARFFRQVPQLRAHLGAISVHDQRVRNVGRGGRLPAGGGGDDQGDLRHSGKFRHRCNRRPAHGSTGAQRVLGEQGAHHFHPGEARAVLLLPASHTLWRRHPPGRSVYSGSQKALTALAAPPRLRGAVRHIQLRGCVRRHAGRPPALHA
jgi:hypothetical protein